MIRKFRNEDLEQIMQLWLQSNIQAHGFIEKTYWKSHYSEVRKMMPEAEIYVFDCEDGIRDSLSLHVYLKNERAVRFYKKEGFHIAGEQTDIETGEQEYLMEWKKKVL